LGGGEYPVWIYEVTWGIPGYSYINVTAMAGGARWSTYKGDVAMVVHHGGIKYLVAIPRILTSQSRDVQRPPQSLFPAHFL